MRKKILYNKGGHWW